MFTGIDYNVIYNNAPGLGFLAPSSEASPAGYYAQTTKVNTGTEKLDVHGAWKFFRQSAVSDAAVH